MSRTRHHRSQKRQHIGEDLWSKRGYSFPYSSVGKWLSKRAERARLKREDRNEIDAATTSSGNNEEKER